MSIYKFRVLLEQDDSIFRDIEIKPSQSFKDFHEIILKSFGFDDKHDASFFVSNDNWSQGEEFSLKKKQNAQLMSKTQLASTIDDPHQKFIFVYDYEVEWTFLIELFEMVEEKKKTTYPRIARIEGTAPKQYGAQPIAGGVDEEFEAEEKYDEHDADDMNEEHGDDEIENKNDDEENESDEFSDEMESDGQEEY
jgi:Plasmid pRiA4b ORF-3-like protein